MGQLRGLASFGREFMHQDYASTHAGLCIALCCVGIIIQRGTWKAREAWNADKGPRKKLG